MAAPPSSYLHAPATPMETRLHHTLSDVTLTATPVSGTVTPDREGNPTDVPCSDPLDEHRRWLNTVGEHGRARADSAIYSCETDFPIGEDSEDDFKFNLFGQSRISRHIRQGYNRKVQNAKAKELQADNFLIDVPTDDKSEAVKFTSDLDLVKFEGLELEKLKLNRLYYTSLVKLNMRLSILSKVIEAITMAKAGFQYSVRSWISLGVNLAMNIVSSCCILWRFSGKYSLPEEAVSPDLKYRLQRREKRCVLCQAICKFVTASALLAFAICNIVKPSSLTDKESFLQSTYLTAGFATGGSITRMSLTTWISYLSRKGLGQSKAVSSESVLSWLTAGFSLETAIIAYYLTSTNSDVEKAWQAFEYGHYVEVGLAGLMVLYGIRDLAFSSKSMNTAPLRVSVSAELNEDLTKKQ
eukprot:Gregarina_sp_Pseudo_9__5147@NODE_544_length_2600_cov_34_446701_g514_i0_p1_GENE_NODE_544_length_2600_cov_34_446701_g514_i0NODE_544_length_2600_cov_34_446701_g514_i0_p1_ORF_typecomplete_len412_score34_29_NODE_544_length_2600_cov_34_446701_g514_i03581593